MGKLTLDLNKLKVDSFITSDEKEVKGTVHGNLSNFTDCGQNTCPDDECTIGSCPDTCYESCGGTCNTCQGNTCVGDTCYAGCTYFKIETCGPECIDL